MFNQITAFFKEAYSELQKVTWLSRQEVVSSTLVIIVLVTIISIFIAFIDFIFIKLIGWII